MYRSPYKPPSFEITFTKTIYSQSISYKKKIVFFPTKIVLLENSGSQERDLFLFLVIYRKDTCAPSTAVRVFYKRVYDQNLRFIYCNLYVD